MDRRDRVVDRKADEILKKFTSDIVKIYDEEAKRNKESKYNQTIAENNSNIFLFDKAHIKLGNKAQYEVCDLFTLNKELIQRTIHKDINH